MNTPPRPPAHRCTTDRSACAKREGGVGGWGGVPGKRMFGLVLAFKPGCCAMNDVGEGGGSLPRCAWVEEVKTQRARGCVCVLCVCVCVCVCV